VHNKLQQATDPSRQYTLFGARGGCFSAQRRLLWQAAAAEGQARKAASRG